MFSALGYVLLRLVVWTGRGLLHIGDGCRWLAGRLLSLATILAAWVVARRALEEL